MASLGDYPAAPILRAEDLSRAKSFYTDVLGLRAIDTPSPAAVGAFSAGDGTVLLIYEMPGMPAPGATTTKSCKVCSSNAPISAKPENTRSNGAPR